MDYPCSALRGPIAEKQADCCKIPFELRFLRSCYGSSVSLASDSAVCRHMPSSSISLCTPCTHTMVTGSIPEALGNLRALTELYLNANKLTGELELKFLSLFKDRCSSVDSRRIIVQVFQRAQRP